MTCYNNSHAYHTSYILIYVLNYRINILVVLTAENDHVASINGAVTDLDHCWVR